MAAVRIVDLLPLCVLNYPNAVHRREKQTGFAQGAKAFSFGRCDNEAIGIVRMIVTEKALAQYF